MLIKTTAERYPALEQALRAGHPYELPERSSRSQSSAACPPISTGWPPKPPPSRETNSRRLPLARARRPAFAQFFKKADELLEPERRSASARARARRRGRGQVRHRRRLLHVPRQVPLQRGRQSVGAAWRAEMPRGARHKDEFFGETETYRGRCDPHPGQGEGRFELKVVSQGCATSACATCRWNRRPACAWSRPRTRPGPAGPREVDAQPRWSIFASDMDIARLFEATPRWCWRASSASACCSASRPACCP